MKALTTTGTLPRGLMIEGVRYTTFELREAEVADMIQAEAETGTVATLAYHLQLAVLQLVSVSNAEGAVFKGPFVASMIRKRGDFAAIREAQIRLDELGNDEPDASSTTGTPSS
ncbi:hypothetical protein [Metapseudomonas otitidis]|uniref:hypothetical protein n=1 Tax=Metapseudomonas otitidis TaxID=319939 RepID=UPI002449F8C4|nr:hypothetical protein [Pseudomonas otitidis]MDH0337586.1 hypothetical protein [Pseudomonas otitidis]